MADRPDFDRLGDLLPAGDEGAAPFAGPAPAAERRGAAVSSHPPVSGAGDPRAGDLSRQLATVWADAVGAEVAGNAKPVQLRDGRLVVTTSSSAWAQTLQLMSEMVIARLNERLGAGAVQKAVFRHAGWEDFSPAAGGGPAAGAPATVRKPRGSGGREAGTVAPSASGQPRPAEPDAPQPLAPPTETGPPGAADGPGDASPSGGAPAPVAHPGAAPGPAGDDLAGFTDEEKQALADLERLPLSPSVKQTIRDAMKAGFVRARQDSGRS